MIDKIWLIYIYKFLYKAHIIDCIKKWLVKLFYNSALPNMSKPINAQ